MHQPLDVRVIMAGTAIRVTFINLCGRLAAKEQTPVILVLMLITGRADTAEQGERVRLSLKTDASFFCFFLYGGQSDTPCTVQMSQFYLFS